MKLSKVLLGSLFAAAMLGLFAGCTKEDDPYNMITEKNSSTWEINHTNEDADTVHRGYKSTNYAHAGALVNIHYDAKVTTANGVMGIIFGLHANATNSKANDFFVIGTRDDGTYYVSGYKLVTDLQGDNFGASTTTVDSYSDFEAATECTEWVIKKFSAATGTTSNGYDIGFYFKDVVDSTTPDANSLYDHHYEIYWATIDTAKKYDINDDTGVISNTTDKTELSLGTKFAEFSYKSSEKDPQQYKFAPYANVYPAASKCSSTYAKAKGTGTLKGTWSVPADYLHADVVED